MSNQPLADMARPTCFDEIVGQHHLFGKNGAIRRMVEKQHLTNMIFYGPPGTGKTTAANIIAASADMRLHKLNATSASIADIKQVIAETSTVFAARGILLYLDEIQYFNKKQQQSLLEYIEDGRITLIASTTENPFIYVYAAVLSRSAVFEFKAVTAEDIIPALYRGLDILNKLNNTQKTADDDLFEYIAACGAGDVRRSINLLENVYYMSGNTLTRSEAMKFSSKTVGNFDRAGNVHYDMLSALQKSIRGSDPDAAVFYLAKILEGGDLIGACRRLQVIASEDIGLAYPNASVIIRSCVESAFDLGMPEAAIPLSNAVITLATAPKSNSAYVAYASAKADIDSGKGQNVPPHMRPSHKYDGYKYPHEFPNHYIEQQYLPDDLLDSKYYFYGDNKIEQSAKTYWDKIKRKDKDKKLDTDMT